MPDEPAPAARLDEVRRRLGLSVHDLWIGYFASGGNALVDDVRHWLDGTVALHRSDSDLLAQALHDHALGEGLDPGAYLNGV